MSQKKKKKQAQAFSTKHQQLEDDWRAIDSFCETFDIDEISLEDWGQVHQSLDLIIEITIRESEAENGVDRLLEYTRTIRKTPVLGQAAISEKRKSRCVVQIAAGKVACASIVFKGRGDRRNDEIGDLIVKTRVVPG